MTRLLCVFVAVIWLAAPAKVYTYELFNDDLRSPSNQALVQSYQQKAQQQLQQQSGVGAPVFAPLPPASPIYSSSQANVGPANLGSASDNVDVRVSDLIARNVLNFAQNLSKQLSLTYRKTEIFSPLSVMSALALLMLGSKGRNYEELSYLFGLQDSQLKSNPGKLHEQFGLLLSDIQQPSLDTVSPQRNLDPWRNTRSGSVRNNRRDSNRPIVHNVYVANGLFTQLGYTLNADYKQVVESIYKSEIQALDFIRSPEQARFTINDWVEQHTQGMITNIIPDPIEQSTRIIMASALYFKAFWEQDFIDTATRPDNFYPNGEGQPPIKVDMMATGGTYPYYEDELTGVRIIGLPYRGNMTTMYVIQPHDSTAEKLRQLRQKLDADQIEYLITRMVKRSALLAFPKLHITESFNMKKMLQHMGIGGIFSTLESDLSLIGSDAPVSQATRAAGIKGRSNPYSSPMQSLSNLEALRNAATPVGRQQSDLFVEDIVHKVDFIVNEQGTEAAAATITYLKKSGPDVLFRADAPFMLLVRHDPTKLVLFYGVVNEPTASTSA